MVDVSHPGWEEQYETVERVLAQLGVRNGRRLIAFNKVDRLTHSEQAAIEARAGALMGSHVFTSTIEPAGLAPLREALRAMMRNRWPAVRLRIPAKDGSALAEVYREGEVLVREEDGTQIEMTARLPSEVLGRLREREGIAILEPPAA